MAQQRTLTKADEQIVAAVIEVRTEDCTFAVERDGVMIEPRRQVVEHIVLITSEGEFRLTKDPQKIVNNNSVVVEISEGPDEGREIEFFRSAQGDLMVDMGYEERHLEELLDSAK